MKHLLKIIFIFLLFVVFGCKSGKYIADFDIVKKDIDTLTIIPTFVDIKAIQIDGKTCNDTIFDEKVSDTISSIITDLLDTKYSIKKINNRNKINATIANDFNELFYRLNNSRKIITDISIPTSIINSFKYSKTRYCIITYYGGVYTTSERIKQNNNEVLPTSIAVAMLTLGSVYVVPSNQNKTIIRVLLYDNREKKVLYYNSSFGNGVHPISISTIKEYIYKNLKSIYYK